MLSVFNQEAKHLETGFLGQCAKRNDCLWYVHMSRTIDIWRDEVKGTIRLRVLPRHVEAGVGKDLLCPAAGRRGSQSELMERGLGYT